jgi:hypothetical protein
VEELKRVDMIVMEILQVINQAHNPKQMLIIQPQPVIKM